MGEEGIGYVDWNEIVVASETNLEIIKANLKRATIGLIMEQRVLDFARVKRDKFEKPEEEASENP